MPECGHCIEVEAMDNWMAMEGGGQIQPKCCPRCKTTVRTCLRYGDIIKSTYEDIAKVKQKMLNVRGNPLDFFNKTSAQLSACDRLFNKMNILGPQKNSVVIAIENELTAIRHQLKRKRKSNGTTIDPPIGPDQRYQILVNLDFMERVLEMMEKILRDQYPSSTKNLASRVSDIARFSLPSRPIPDRNLTTPMTPEFVNKFSAVVHKLLRSVIDRDRISVEENRAVGRELDRLDLVRAYYVLQSHPTYTVSGKNTPERELVERLLTKNIEVLKEEEKREIKTALETLGDKLRAGLGISDGERREIVSAMGMLKGHWFKCPNGHIYAIGECGGAMEVSRCNECHALIGGTRHRLLDGNALAGEMDGANQPSWPQ